jgi:hypothetical protein
MAKQILHRQSTPQCPCDPQPLHPSGPAASPVAFDVSHRLKHARDPGRLGSAPSRQVDSSIWGRHQGVRQCHKVYGGWTASRPTAQRHDASRLDKATWTWWTRRSSGSGVSLRLRKLSSLLHGPPWFVGLHDRPNGGGNGPALISEAARRNDLTTQR